MVFKVARRVTFVAFIATRIPTKASVMTVNLKHIPNVGTDVFAARAPFVTWRFAATARMEFANGYQNSLHQSVHPILTAASALPSSH